MLTWLAVCVILWIVASCPLAVVVGRVIAGPTRIATVIPIDSARRTSGNAHRGGSAHAG
jgi:hypothetical protein